VAGLQGLAVSIPVAALVATAVAGPAIAPALTPHLLLAGLGLALLLPVVPFSLEMCALRRLTTAAFGTLMCLEPAFAVLAGFVLLGQAPRPWALAGVAFVVAAGLGAERAGARPARTKPAPEPAIDTNHTAQVAAASTTTSRTDPAPIALSSQGRATRRSRHPGTPRDTLPASDLEPSLLTGNHHVTHLQPDSRPTR
jgi:hypothetical protein